MLRRRSSTSSINTPKLKDRQLKAFLQLIKQRGKFLLVVLATLIFFVFINKFFIIKELSCHSNNLPCNDGVTNLLQYTIGKNALTLNEKKITDIVKGVYPVDKLSSSFVFPNKLNVEIEGWKSSVVLATFQVPILPTLSLDEASKSTESAFWRKPSIELNNYVLDKDAKFNKLWENGWLTPDATNSAEIKMIYVETPSEESLSSFYKIILLAQKYLEKPKIIITGSRILLSQESQPDIIIYVPTEVENVELSLQSIDYLYTIKKDARVIDLSFKHPIIK